MINLLPNIEKEALLSERNKKLFIVLSSIVLISLFCLILVLISFKFYLLQQLKYQKIILDDARKQYQNSNLSSFKEVVQKYNASLIKIDNFYKKEIYFSDVLKTILDIKKPSSLYFTSINIQESLEDKKIKVAIGGVSDTRDNLLIFKDNIENNKAIENVYFPPDSWIKPTFINFYLTFKINQSN